MNHTVGLLLLITCTFIVDSELKVVQADDGVDIYSAADDVVRLTTATFNSTIFQDNKNVTFVVQFYNSFCGHCQMFAPIYKELGTRVRNWTSVIQIAGIDCSKDENIATCSENKIEGYPTILIFPPNSHYGDPKDKPLSLRSLNIEWTVDDIEDTLVDYIGNLTIGGRLYPLVADALQPIKATDLSGIQRIYPQNSNHDVVNDYRSLQDLLFLVESDKSYIGRKLILEYFRINTKLELRRILLSNKVLLENILPEGEYSKLDDSEPLLLRVNTLDNGSKAQVLVRGEAKHVLSSLEDTERQDYIYGRFRAFFEHYYTVELKEMNWTSKDRIEIKPNASQGLEQPTSEQSDESEILHLIHNDANSSKRVFAMDLLKSISYMITHEIRIRGDLDAKEFTTVRNLLTILKKYLPLGRWDPLVENFILELRTVLDKNREKYEKDGITNEQMKDLLDFSGSDKIRLKYNKENWISCYESERRQKGYTCSLWLLFHALTVGEYTKIPPVRSRPTLVLTTMRDYVIRFLGCTVCSSNFVKETENLESNLTNRNSSVLWLWDTHNHVNQRLNREREKMRPLNEVVFPAHHRCPDCYRQEPDEITSDDKTLDDIQFNKTAIFNYMKEMYRPDKLVTPKEMFLLLAGIRGKVNFSRPSRFSSNQDLNRSLEQWDIQSIFSTSDMSICLFLYLSCIVIVAIVCLSLNPKWKRLVTKRE